MGLRTLPVPIIVAPNPPEKELPVDQIYQGQTEWCWAGCAEMIFRYYSLLRTDQCEIATFLFGKQCCPDRPECNCPCKVSDIATIFSNWHLTSHKINSPIPYNQIKNEINSERPIEIVLTWNGGYQHAAVIYGWQDLPFGGSVFVNDPANGPGPVDYTYLKKAYGYGKWTHTWDGISKQKEGA